MKFNTHSLIESKNRMKSIYLVLIVLIIVQRLFWFFQFATVYTDSDQTVMWQAACDFADGIFRAPCFYGQSYNPFIESILAAPFVALGLPVWIALPAITSLFAIFPILFLANYFKKTGNNAGAIITLTVILAMPPEYFMLTSVSRGFVIGIALGIVSLVLFLRSHSSRQLFAAGLTLSLALFANLNAALLLPLFIPDLLSGKLKSIKNIGGGILGFLIGLMSFVLNGLFYHLHPEMIIHASPSMHFSVSAFVSIISRLDSYFNFITPVLWRFGYVLILGIPVLALILFRKGDKIKGFTVVAVFVMLLISMFSYKAADGTNSVYFSGSRMYLAYPFLLVFLLNFGYGIMGEQSKRGFIKIALALSALSFIIHLAFSNTFIQSEMRGSKNKIVQVTSISALKENCIMLEKFASQPNTLIVSTQASVVAYGCPCLLPNFPNTIVAGYERRSWLTDKFNNFVFDNIIISEADSSFVNQFSKTYSGFFEYLPEQKLIILQNKLNTQQFLQNKAFIK